jgi:phenylpropionate dioxygenase-like ring-hydroxylating dioxygenase large terminal subunit
MTDLQASLRPSDYVDPAVYEVEVERVLRSSWIPVCRVDQVGQPGSRFGITLVGEPVVAVRDHGTIRVLANVCAHRGSQLVDDGPGVASTLVCPYHRWAYRLDGSFIGAPLAEGGDLDGVCLREVRHVIWEGFVLVNLSADAPEPFDELAGLADTIAPWRWTELVTVGEKRFESTWNWKVMVENWIECYHHLGTHRETVEAIQPARTTRLVPNGGAPWAAMTVESIEGIVGDPSTWIPGLPSDRSRDLSVWSAFPLLLGGSMSRYAFWLHVVPIDVTRHVVTWYLLAHPDQLVGFTPDAVTDSMETLADVHREDMATCARVQVGLASGLIDRLRLTPLEAPIADFQRWISSRLDRVD